MKTVGGGENEGGGYVGRTEMRGKAGNEGKN